MNVLAMVYAVFVLLCKICAACFGYAFCRYMLLAMDSKLCNGILARITPIAVFVAVLVS